MSKTKQIKPRWYTFSSGRSHYGIRVENNWIALKEMRPWYRGYYFVNGVNTHYLDDPDGRYRGPTIRAIRKQLRAA